MNDLIYDFSSASTSCNHDDFISTIENLEDENKLLHNELLNRDKIENNLHISITNSKSEKDIIRSKLYDISFSSTSCGCSHAFHSNTSALQAIIMLLTCFKYM